jgi:preprotein translocase subunit SecA
MQVVPVPTRKPCIRKKRRSVYASDEQTKLRLICETVDELSRDGQPVLVGSRSVGKSEVLARMLDQMGIDYTLLNARNEAHEAAIVDQTRRRRRGTRWFACRADGA